LPNVYQFKNFTGSSHRILIDLVRRHSRGGTLLDLGAAGGELGAELRSHFDRRIGYEYNRERIPELRPRFDHVVIADLEQTDTLPRNADAIVLADVIEHLKAPKRILSLVRSSLRPDGVAFVSVPNIANITIRIGLLFGIFRYRERGILDETHLRFYTLQTIREEVEAAGFEIVDVRGSAVPIRLIIGHLLPNPLLVMLEWLLMVATQMWKALLAYQIVLVLKPRRAERTRAIQAITPAAEKAQ
jgi:predicted TPR repeat methyltransferase